MKDFIIAVDFDGTCVEHEFPKMGKDTPAVVETLLWLQSKGVKIILWTMRSGDFLTAAQYWFQERGIHLYGVNSNPTQQTWTLSPKAYAHMYIDDAALGCPLAINGGRAYVHWPKVREHLELHHFPIEQIHYEPAVNKSRDRTTPGKRTGR